VVKHVRCGSHATPLYQTCVLAAALNKASVEDGYDQMNAYSNQLRDSVQSDVIALWSTVPTEWRVAKATVGALLLYLLPSEPYVGVWGTTEEMLWLETIDTKAL
jgi:hypothetical protein